MKVKKLNIPIIFLTLMSVQYIPLEGNGISNVKLTAMCCAPIIWLFSFKTLSKAFTWAFYFLLITSLSILYNIDSFRLSTVMYKISFVLMFVMFYDFVYHKSALSLEKFIRFLKSLILCYGIVLLLQQIFILVGLRYFPLINLMGFLDRGIGANSLALEPSHSARILTAAMLVLLRMTELGNGRKKVRVKEFYKEHKWVVLGFLWSMLTMGSGTAFVGLGILLLYFLKGRNIFYSSLFLIGSYYSTSLVNYEPLERARNAVSVTLTLDKEEVINQDYSAAARIVPLINTFLSLDLSKQTTWLGKGVDTSVNAEYLSEDQKIGGISDYGLISFLASIGLVYACCIRQFWSLENLIFLILLGLTVSNIAYCWAILMLLTTSKYFQNNEYGSHSSYMRI